MNMALLDQQSFSQQSQTVLTFKGSKLRRIPYLGLSLMHESKTINKKIWRAVATRFNDFLICLSQRAVHSHTLSVAPGSHSLNRVPHTMPV